MVFPVVMYGCASWTIKKAEHQQNDVFELWCWRRLLGVPWTARRPNQSILKEISPECSLEGLMLKLKPQYSGHLMWRTDSLEKTLMLGKIEGGRKGDDRGWDSWMASPAQWTWVWVSSGSWWWTGKPGMLQSMGSQRVRYDWATEMNWTECIRMGSPDSSVGIEPTCNAGDPGSIPWPGRFAGEGTGYPFKYSWASLVAQLVKNPLREILVQSLGWEDPMEKGKTTQSSILTWRIPWNV